MYSGYTTSPFDRQEILVSGRSNPVTEGERVSLVSLLFICLWGSGLFQGFFFFLNNRKTNKNLKEGGRVNAEYICLLWLPSNQWAGRPDGKEGPAVVKGGVCVHSGGHRIGVLTSGASALVNDASGQSLATKRDRRWEWRGFWKVWRTRQKMRLLFYMCSLGVPSRIRMVQCSPPGLCQRKVYGCWWDDEVSFCSKNMLWFWGWIDPKFLWQLLISKQTCWEKAPPGRTSGELSNGLTAVLLEAVLFL